MVERPAVLQVRGLQGAAGGRRERRAGGRAACTAGGRAPPNGWPNAGSVALTRASQTPSIVCEDGGASGLAASPLLPQHLPAPSQRGETRDPPGLKS